MTPEPTQPNSTLRHAHARAELRRKAAGRRRRPRIDRFVFTYLRREVRGRLRQALLTALGLGVGAGLFVIVTAVSAGVRDAQSTVLHSLYGIGTDLTVTEPRNNRAGSGLAAQNPNALIPGDLGLLPATWIDSVARLTHVASAAGGLQLTELTQSGGIPQTIPLDGVDVTHPNLGPLDAGTFTSGHTFPATDRSSNVAILAANYAIASKLEVGSMITLNTTKLRVIGIVNQAQGTNAADIYLPLGRAQALAQSPAGKNLTGHVNVIYVAAASATDIPAVQGEITHRLPNATVSSTSNLAGQVSGSLASAASLTNDLGKWVAVAALIAALVIASLLTTAAVNRRTRELGTLKALGWSTQRIVSQVMSESAAVGVIGAAIGVGIGFAGAALVGAIAPKLSAIVAQGTGTGQSTPFSVRLMPDVSAVVLVIAVLLAIAGALLAGSAGAWRASKLQPADAFAQIN